MMASGMGFRPQRVRRRIEAGFEQRPTRLSRALLAGWVARNPRRVARPDRDQSAARVVGAEFGGQFAAAAVDLDPLDRLRREVVHVAARVRMAIDEQLYLARAVVAGAGGAAHLH